MENKKFSSEMSEDTCSDMIISTYLARKSIKSIEEVMNKCQIESPQTLAEKRDTLDKKAAELKKYNATFPQRRNKY